MCRSGVYAGVASVEAGTRNIYEFRARLPKNLADYLTPFRERRSKLASDPDHVWDVLHDGAGRASAIASQVIAEVKTAVGLP